MLPAVTVTKTSKHNMSNEIFLLCVDFITLMPRDMFCYLDPLFLALNGFKQFVMILWQKFGASTMKSLIYCLSFMVPYTRTYRGLSISNVCGMYTWVLCIVYSIQIMF